MYKVIKEEFGEIYSGINPSEAKSVFSRHKDKGHNVYLLNGDDLMDKFECGGKVNKEAYADGGEIEEWKKYVLENSSWFDDETEEESTTNQIYLTTRENGNVGDEEVGQKDINEAKNIVKKVVAKFPKTQYEIEEVDEWVHLTLMPNKTNEQLADEKIEKKHNQTKKESSKLIAKALKIKEEKALEIIEDFSYAKEYYEKNKGSKSTLPNRAFRVYYSHGSPTIKFENAQQVFDFITKDDFAKDFYYSANPRNKVAIYLYGWDALRINFDKDARPILPNGETDWGSKGKVLTVYPFLEENIESEKDFTQKVDKVISDFIIAYKIYVLQDTGFVSTYADGGEVENRRKIAYELGLRDYTIGERKNPYWAYPNKEGGAYENFLAYNEGYSAGITSSVGGKIFTQIESDFNKIDIDSFLYRMDYPDRRDKWENEDDLSLGISDVFRAYVLSDRMYEKIRRDFTKWAEKYDWYDKVDLGQSRSEDSNEYGNDETHLTLSVKVKPEYQKKGNGINVEYAEGGSIYTRKEIDEIIEKFGLNSQELKATTLPKTFNWKKAQIIGIQDPSELEKQGNYLLFEKGIDEVKYGVSLNPDFGKNPKLIEDYIGIDDEGYYQLLYIYERTPKTIKETERFTTYLFADGGEIDKQEAYRIGQNALWERMKAVGKKQRSSSKKVRENANKEYDELEKKINYADGGEVKEVDWNDLWDFAKANIKGFKGNMRHKEFSIPDEKGRSQFVMSRWVGKTHIITKSKNGKIKDEKEVSVNKAMSFLKSLEKDGSYADGGEIKNLMKASGYIYKNYYYDIPRFEKKYGFTPKPPYFDIRPNGLVGISKKGREVIKQDDLGVKRNWESIGVSSYADGGKVKWDIGQVIGNTGNDGEYYTMDGKVGWVERPSGIVGRIVDIKDGYYIINVAGSVDGRWIDKAKIKITDPYYDLNRYYADGGRIGKAKQRRISKLKHTISNLIKDIIELEEEKNSLDKTDSHYQEDYNDIIELINDDKRELKKKENILSRNESQTYRDYADGGEVDGWKDKIQKDDDGSGFILMKDAPPINYITETKPNGTKIYTLTPPIFSPQSINTSAYTILKLKQVKSGQWRGLYEFEDGRKEWLQINKPQGLAYIRDIDLYNDDKEGYPDMRYSGRVLEQHYGGIDIIDYFGWRSKMGDGGEVTSGAGANAIFDEVQDTLDALKEMLGIYGSSPEDIENKKSIQAQIDELTQKSTKAVKKVANVIPDPSEIEEIEIPKELEGEIIDWIDDINFDVEFEKGGAVYTTQEAELMITNIINQIGKYALGYGLAREFKASEEDGFLKLSFLTSGKNKKDVKINVLYSGDSDNYIIETIGNGKKKNYIDIGWDDLTPTIMAIADDIGGKRPQLKKGGKVANPMKGKVNRAISKSGGLSSFAFESFSGGLSEDQRKSALINKKILISHTKPIHSLLSQDTGENIFAINGYHSLRDGFVEEALEENSDKLNFEQQDKLADLFNEFVNKIRTTKN